MASYQSERERFIAQVTREGLDLRAAQALLRCATTINRLAELACSSEAADRDRIPCPASKTHNPADCLCDVQPSRESAEYPAEHSTIPRITLQEWQAEQRAMRAVPAGWTVLTSGDPRGYTLRVVPPSYAERNAGRDRFNLDAIGVPSGPSGLRFRF